MERHKKSLSEMIHTIDEGLFQELLTAFAAGSGKRHWSTTREMDQTCHNCMSASKLAFVSASVGMSLQPEEIKAASLIPMKYQTCANVLNLVKTK